MAADYLHGVETLETEVNGSPIRVVKSSVIALVGLAPTGDAQSLVLVKNINDAAQFGKMLPGFNIPWALDAIYKQGKAGTIAVINVYDPNTHNVSVSAETQTITSDYKAKLDYAPMTAPVIENGTGHTYTVNDDYTIDEYGNIKVFGAIVLGIPEVLAYGRVTVTGGTSSPGVNKITAIKVNGVEILGAAIDWTTSNVITAGLINAQIAAYTSSPEYTASVIGNAIVITALAGTGATPNGWVVAVTAAGDVTTTVVSMAHGVTAIAPTPTINCSYDRFDPTTVSSADIIGGYDSNTDVRTGSFLVDMMYASFGFTAKILLAPGYTELVAVRDRLKALAIANRAVAFIDAPQGTTVTEAIVGRGPLGTINLYLSDDRVYACYPYVKVADPDPGIITPQVVNVVLQPYSQFWAGVTANVDLNEGYHVSPSNHVISGILGFERLISSAINDPNTDANALNAAGIGTYFQAFGTGLRTWGNRSTAWPAVTHPRNFLSVRRTADIIDESTELAMLQFIDGPITAAQIDSIRHVVNNLLSALKQRGAIIDGDCIFDPSQNPPEELALGHLKFKNNFMPPPPGERITFESTIDSSLLSTIFAQQ